MKSWTAGIIAILLASFLGVANAQVDCNATPPGPARTDCYIGLSRTYEGQSDRRRQSPRAIGRRALSADNWEKPLTT
jgi:hypothetical protein